MCARLTFEHSTRAPRYLALLAGRTPAKEKRGLFGWPRKSLSLEGGNELGLKSEASPICR